ncbi:MAG: hypothetical protein V1774_00035, partial [Candidatus Eisenbacteria bacterium]
TIVITSELTGAFLCTGDLYGPQQYAENPIDVEGTLIADKIVLVGPLTRIRHDPAFNSLPLAEMTRPGLRLLAGRTREP